MHKLINYDNGVHFKTIFFSNFKQEFATPICVMRIDMYVYIKIKTLKLNSFHKIKYFSRN